VRGREAALDRPLGRLVWQDVRPYTMSGTGGAPPCRVLDQSPQESRGVFVAQERELRLHVNGETVRVHAPPHWTLLEVLRYRLRLTGTKQGCDKGDCGACTVIIDGHAVLACLTLAVACEGRDIVTIEGLAGPDRLDPVQDAFDRSGAMQCGFCQPGMIMSARALLDRDADPSREAIDEALGGNLCRCTGYTKIIDAVVDAARLVREEQG
jgi:aerobic-type carbon monoxide dehydrogenase small subunit (CoxS/CutS family)